MQITRNSSPGLQHPLCRYSVHKSVNSVAQHLCIFATELSEISPAVLSSSDAFFRALWLILEKTELRRSCLVLKTPGWPTVTPPPLLQAGGQSPLAESCRIPFSGIPHSRILLALLPQHLPASSFLQPLSLWKSTICCTCTMGLVLCIVSMFTATLWSWCPGILELMHYHQIIDNSYNKINAEKE